ncbi:MAG: amidohydrolase family protein, partial [Flavobacteriaceae bacterium]
FLSALKKSTKRGLKSSGHMPFDVTLNQAIDAGMNGVEHLYYILKGSSNKESEITNQFQNDEISFWEAMPLLINTYDESTAKGLFDRLNHKEIFVVPTLYIGHTLSYLDEFDHSDDEYLNILSPALKMTYERRVKSALNSSPETRAQRKKLDEFFRKLTLKLHEAGVELMAGSDAGAYNSYIYPGPSLHKELESLVAVGLSPLEALKTSIVNGPKWLGLEDDYGVIANGKKADILLLKKNPLIDIKNTISIQAVIRSGHLMNKN